MDKTPEYIKQCEKAVKVQEHRPIGERFILGDWAAYRNQRGRIEEAHLLLPEIEITSYECDSDYGDMEKRRRRDIWLPDQSQLQAMFTGHFVDPMPRKLAKALWDWIAHNGPPSEWSMEQLWLAFIMHEKYQKHWNGEDWVETPSQNGGAGG